MRIGWIITMSVAIATAEAPRTPVLIELFTSEGCSSCPPADLLLSRLQSQPIAGVELITLSEHVDYWNQLGWTDPFSSAVLTERQRQYAATLRGEGVYTPQMVVDGMTGFVGSDNQKALQAISEAAKTPKNAVQIRCGGAPSTLVVRIDGPAADSDVTLAIAENGLQSNVTRGENRGRRMTHASVARTITTIGRTRKQQTFSAEPKITIDRSWRRENLSVVVFLQDRTSRRILGAGQIALSACAVT